MLLSWLSSEEPLSQFQGNDKGSSSGDGGECPDLDQKPQCGALPHCTSTVFLKEPCSQPPLTMAWRGEKRHRWTRFLEEKAF